MIKLLITIIIAIHLVFDSVAATHRLSDWMVSAYLLTPSRGYMGDHRGSPLPFGYVDPVSVKVYNSVL